MACYSVSCKKEEIVPGKTTIIPSEAPKSIVGPVWILHSGRVLVENITDGGSRIYYDHFGSNRPISNLDIFTPSSLPFDIIEQDVTTWQFTANNKFILNGVKTYPYEFTSIYSNQQDGVYKPYGLENGSARPIIILDATEE